MGVALTGVARAIVLAPTLWIAQSDTIPADGVVVVSVTPGLGDPTMVTIEVLDETGSLVAGTIEPAIGSDANTEDVWFRFDAPLVVGTTYWVTATLPNGAQDQQALVAIAPWGGGPPAYLWEVRELSLREWGEDVVRCLDTFEPSSERFIPLSEQYRAELSFSFWRDGSRAIAEQYLFRADDGPWSPRALVTVSGADAKASGDLSPCIRLEAYDIAHEVMHDLGTDHCGTFSGNPVQEIVHDPADVLTVEDCVRPADHEALWCEVNRARCAVPADARPDACWAYGFTCLGEPAPAGPPALTTDGTAGQGGAASDPPLLAGAGGGTAPIVDGGDRAASDRGRFGCALAPVRTFDRNVAIAWVALLGCVLGARRRRRRARA